MLRGDLHAAPPAASHRTGGSLGGENGATWPHPRNFPDNSNILYAIAGFVNLFSGFFGAGGQEIAGTAGPRSGRTHREEGKGTSAGPETGGAGEDGPDGPSQDSAGLLSLQAGFCESRVKRETATAPRPRRCW